jgi:hypothetical protein
MNSSKETTLALAKNAKEKPAVLFSFKEKSRLRNLDLKLIFLNII